MLHCIGLFSIVHLFAAELIFTGLKMTALMVSKITAVGPEVEALLDGGVLILFAEGAPAELAEVSVCQRVEHADAKNKPVSGNSIKIAGISSVITAVGELAWDKIIEMGHVVINYNGASIAERPGEICAKTVDKAALLAALKIGAQISIETA